MANGGGGVRGTSPSTKTATDPKLEQWNAACELIKAELIEVTSWSGLRFVFHHESSIELDILGANGLDGKQAWVQAILNNSSPLSFGVHFTRANLDLETHDQSVFAHIFGDQDLCKYCGRHDVIVYDPEVLAWIIKEFFSEP